ncbi:MAG: hypothetical protein ACKVI4_18045, partial [Actinomycetales bacterium]
SSPPLPPWPRAHPPPPPAIASQACTSETYADDPEHPAVVIAAEAAQCDYFRQVDVPDANFVDMTIDAATAGAAARRRALSTPRDCSRTSARCGSMCTVIWLLNAGTRQQCYTCQAECCDEQCADDGTLAPGCAEGDDPFSLVGYVDYAHVCPYTETPTGRCVHLHPEAADYEHTLRSVPFAPLVQYDGLAAPDATLGDLSYLTDNGHDLMGKNAAFNTDFGRQDYIELRIALTQGQQLSRIEIYVQDGWTGLWARDRHHLEAKLMVSDVDEPDFQSFTSPNSDFTTVLSTQASTSAGWRPHTYAHAYEYLMQPVDLGTLMGTYTGINQVLCGGYCHNPEALPGSNSMRYRYSTQTCECYASAHGWPEMAWEQTDHGDNVEWMYYGTVDPDLDDMRAACLTDGYAAHPCQDAIGMRMGGAYGPSSQHFSVDLLDMGLGDLSIKHVRLVLRGGDHELRLNEIVLERPAFDVDLTRTAAGTFFWWPLNESAYHCDAETAQAAYDGGSNHVPNNRMGHPCVCPIDAEAAVASAAARLVVSNAATARLVAAHNLSI